MKIKYLLSGLGLIVGIGIFCTGCKDPYFPPVKSMPTGYLVVEGFINASDPTVIRLTHTRALSALDTATVVPELNATVRVEDNHSGSYELNGFGNGVYILAPVSFNPGYQYRLRISTSAGKEYVSDFVTFKPSPPISNVGWEIKDNGVQLYVNTRDPQQHTRYYRWEYEETWEFHSFWTSELQYDPVDSVVVQRTHQIHVCWNSDQSDQILLGSSAKLSEDVISHGPLTYIPPHDKKMSVLYSILVTQFALDTSGYNYWKAMKSNTENVGSLFDPQPDQTRGNIHCVTDSTEPVIGYIGAGSSQKLRVFIPNSTLPGSWNQPDYCPAKIVPTDSIAYFFGAGWIPIQSITEDDGKVTYPSSNGLCVDCTVEGTTQKPAFWP